MKKSTYALLLLLIISGSNYAQNIQDHLIAHYDFNGNANDLSGNGNDGIVHGPTLTSGRSNIPNTAYYFNGIDDYIQVPDNASFQIADNKVTIALWVKVNYPGNKFFLYKGSNQFNREYSLGLSAGTDSLAGFNINNLGGWDSNQYSVNSKTVIQSDTWYYIVGSWDGKTQKIYVNGMLENTSEPTVQIGDYNSDLYIGTYGGKIEDYAFNGTIDDIMIFNTALTDEEVYQLYFPKIKANFSSDTTMGIVPLTVHFFDQSVITDSTDKILTWEWDFNNDGQIDSSSQNPEWTYINPGIYAVKLTVSDSVNQYTEIKENYITAFSENPYILTVEDVPNDQGKWVKLKFLRSIYDTDSLILLKTTSPELYTVEINDGSGWTAAASTAAYGKTIYTILVPTTKDSTVNSPGTINFRVIASMQEGNFVSDKKAGYSVDNLAPSIPEGLQGILTPNSKVKLEWMSNSEKDFNYYSIYKSFSGMQYRKINTTIDTVFFDDSTQYNIDYYYKISAVDYSGNESEKSNEVKITITDANDKSQIPLKYGLFQNFPNPFNPSTIIRYTVAKESFVNIILYNVLGKQIATLVNESKPAGNYSVQFNAINLPSGIYFYKMQAGTFVETKKLLLLK